MRLEGLSLFFNTQRLKIWPLLFISVYLVVLCLYFFNSTGLIDQKGLPVGSDFITFFSASHLATKGQILDLYNPDKLYSTQKQLAGGKIPFFAWHYPPHFLFFILPLAYLPYLLSLLVWLSVTVFPLLCLLKKIVPHPATAAIFLAFPGTFQNIVHGQNAFLTAFFLGSGLLWLEKKPFRAGILLGMLTYKPHFSVLVIVSLFACKNYRAISGFICSFATLYCLSVYFWGIEPWKIFFNNLFLAQKILETGAVNIAKMPTVFAAARLSSFSVELAQIIQILVGLTMIGLTYSYWQSKQHIAVKTTFTAAASFLTTPFAFDYDLLILSIAIASLHCNFHENTAPHIFFFWGLILWLLPFVGPLTAQLLKINLVPIVLIVFCVFLYLQKNIDNNKLTTQL